MLKEATELVNQGSMGKTMSNYSEVCYNNLNRIFRNKKKFKGKKNFDNQARRGEKLKEARELHGFCNVWTNDGKIFCKSEGNAKPQFYYG